MENKSKIMYIHGFGSQFSEIHTPYLQGLKDIGDVVGISYDYTAAPQTNIDTLISFIESQTKKVDIIVGCSLGAWYASHIGMKTSLPVVMINPCLEPYRMLHEYIGDGEDHYNKSYTFTQENCFKYTDIETNCTGCILIDRGDEVIPHTDIDLFEFPFQKIIKYEGGSHRFEHMEEATADINYSIRLSRTL